MLIIWITWTLGAGKWTVVEYLKEKYTFHHLPVRAYLIDKIQHQWLEVNRDSMVIVANTLREKYGPWHIVEELYHQAQLDGWNTIIESIRTPGEITALKAKWPFLLLAVDADPSIRYERIVSRASETDHVSYAQFLENEAREMSSSDPHKQNLAACIALADYRLMNDGDIHGLYEQIDEIMKKIV